MSGVAVGLLATITLTFAQDRRDEWRLRTTSDSTKVKFSIERHRDRNNWSNTNTVPLARFKGLTLAQLNGSGPAKFEYVADAGRLICDGVFNNGSGIGSYKFQPNQQFSSQLTGLGYDAPTEEQMFTMMLVNVGLELAKAVRETGLTSSTKELIELGIHGVSPQYIKEVRDLGYKDLTARNFVELKIHGVSADYIREMKASGFDVSAKQMVEFKIHGVSPEYFRQLKAYGLQPNAREIVEYKIHGVTPEFLKSLKDAGYTDLTGRQVTEMKIHGITPEYIAQLKSFGLQPTQREIVEYKIHGITPEYLKAMKDSGVAMSSPKEVVALKIHGVSPQFVNDSKQLGYSFTAKELTQLKIHGVDSAYLRKLQSSGLKNLTADKIAQLKIHGID